MSKWAPAREDGKKPWVRTVSEWGWSTERIVWADSAQDAKCIEPIMRYASVRVRRAEPQDMTIRGGTTEGGAA